MVQPYRPSMTTRRMRFGCWITGYRHTLRIRIARAERDGTCTETRFRLSPKRTSPFKSVGASVQSTAGSRGVRISWIYHVRRWRERTGYPLHSPFSPSLPPVRHRVPPGSERALLLIAFPRQQWLLERALMLRYSTLPVLLRFVQTRGSQC